MKNKPSARNGRPKPTVALVTKALNQAAQDAVEVHRRAGLPLAVLKNGKTILVAPESIKATTKSSSRRRKSRSA